MPQATMIMTAISAVSSYVGGQQQATAAANAANAQSRAAWENYNVQKNQLEQESQQLANQEMMEKSERAKQLMLEQARIKTIAGETGIVGNSVDALLQDSYMQAGIDMTVSRNNILSRQMKNTAETGQSYAVAKNRSTEANMRAQDAYDKAPSLLGTALQISMAGKNYEKETGKKIF